LRDDEAARGRPFGVALCCDCLENMIQSERESRKNRISGGEHAGHDSDADR
jgi:hypothetical protein